MTVSQGPRDHGVRTFVPSVLLVLVLGLDLYSMTIVFAQEVESVLGVEEKTRRNKYVLTVEHEPVPRSRSGFQFLDLGNLITTNMRLGTQGSEKKDARCCPLMGRGVTSRGHQASRRHRASW